MVIGPPGERDSDNLDCVGKDDLKASHNGHSCRGLQLYGPNQAVLVMGERKDEKGGKSDRNIPDWTGKERFEKNTIRYGGNHRHINLFQFLHTAS